MNKNVIRIVLCGLSFSSPNLGCSALAYAFRELLLEMFEGSGTQLKLAVLSNVDCADYVAVKILQGRGHQKSRMPCLGSTNIRPIQQWAGQKDRPMAHSIGG